MWYKNLENPFFLKSLYKVIPDLKEVELVSIQVINDGPTLRVAFNIGRFADNPPKKWDQPYNTVRLVIEFFDLKNLRWIGWGVNVFADIAIHEEQGKNKVQIKSEIIDLSFEAKFFRVERIDGYCIDPNCTP